MKKIFKFMMILVVGLGFIACTPVSEGPGYVEPPVEPETPTETPVEPETPPEVTTYEVKFEVVETEYWCKVKGLKDLVVINESEVEDFAIDYIENHKPSFETKTLKENEEYILKDYNEWMFGSEEEPDSRIEVQYFSDEGLISPIEPGSVIKNENKTIYVKFVYYFYKNGYKKSSSN